MSGSIPVVEREVFRTRAGCGHVRVAWTPELDAYVDRRRSEGASFNVVGSELLLDGATIRNRMKARSAPLVCGGAPRSGRKPIEWTPEADQYLRDKRGEGWSLHTIGREIGMHPDTVRARVVSLGLPIHRVTTGLRNHVSAPVDPRCRAAPPLPDADDRENGVGPLPAGHPTSWDMLTAGTCMAGAAYPGRPWLAGQAPDPKATPACEVARLVAMAHPPATTLAVKARPAQVAICEAFWRDAA